MVISKTGHVITYKFDIKLSCMNNGIDYTINSAHVADMSIQFAILTRKQPELFLNLQSHHICILPAVMGRVDIGHGTATGTV